MRVVLDTNVFVSGVFFTGPPHSILAAWSEGKLGLVISSEILDEYRRTGRVLSEKYPGVDLDPILSLLALHAEIVLAPALPQSVCTDQDDDKFLACALASRCKTIISGDRALLRADGYEGIRVIRPRAFVDTEL